MVHFETDLDMIRSNLADLNLVTEERINYITDFQKNLNLDVIRLIDNQVVLTENIAVVLVDMASMREEMASSQTAIREDMANIREEIASSRAAIREEIASSQTSIREDMASSQAAIREEMANNQAAIREDMASMMERITQMLSRLPAVVIQP